MSAPWPGPGAGAEATFLSLTECGAAHCDSWKGSASTRILQLQKAPSKLRCYETSSGEGASVSQLPLESAHQRTICRELCAVQSHPDSGDRGWRFMPPSQTRSPAPNLANLQAAELSGPKPSPTVPVPLLPCDSASLRSALHLWAAEPECESVGSVGERQDATAMAE